MRVYGGTLTERKIVIRFVNDDGRDEEVEINENSLLDKAKKDAEQEITDNLLRPVVDQLLQERQAQIEASSDAEEVKRASLATLYSPDNVRRLTHASRAMQALTLARTRTQGVFNRCLTRLQDALRGVYELSSTLHEDVVEKKQATDLNSAQMIDALYSVIRAHRIAQGVQEEIELRELEISSSDLSAIDKSKNVALLRSAESVAAITEEVSNEVLLVSSLDAMKQAMMENLTDVTAILNATIDTVTK
jgi:hypothetical protein